LFDPAGRSRRKELNMTAALALACQIALAAGPAAPPAPASVYALTQDAFAQQARHDLEQLHHFADGLRRIDDTLAAHPELFHRKEKATYSPEQKQILLTRWGGFFNYEMAVELIRQRYWDFIKIPPAGTLMHAWGYLLTHLALTTEEAHGLKFA